MQWGLLLSQICPKPKKKILHFSAYINKVHLLKIAEGLILREKFRPEINFTGLYDIPKSHNLNGMEGSWNGWYFNAHSNNFPHLGTDWSIIVDDHRDNDTKNNFTARIYCSGFDIYKIGEAILLRQHVKHNEVI